jgi:hypothetical protein
MHKTKVGKDRRQRNNGEGFVKGQPTMVDSEVKLNFQLYHLKAER